MQNKDKNSLAYFFEPLCMYVYLCIVYSDYLCGLNRLLIELLVVVISRLSGCHNVLSGCVYMKHFSATCILLLLLFLSVCVQGGSN